MLSQLRHIVVAVQAVSVVGKGEPCASPCKARTQVLVFAHHSL